MLRVIGLVTTHPRNTNQNHHETVTAHLLGWLLRSQKTTKDKGRQGCGEIRTFEHCY